MKTRYNFSTYLKEVIGYIEVIWMAFFISFLGFGVPILIAYYILDLFFHF